MGIKTFTLRFTPEEHEMLERGAAEKCMNKNQFILYLILTYNEVGCLMELSKKISNMADRVEIIGEKISKEPVNM